VARNWRAKTKDAGSKKEVLMTIIVGSDGKKRCFGDKPGKEFYAKYHDEEWGIPSHDDRHLFEMLILEGAQAGLSWETILQRRDGYRSAFHNFDAQKVADMTDEALEVLRSNPAIIRNRLKIYAARQNAQVFLDIQQEFKTFDTYLWRFVPDHLLLPHWQNFKDVPTKTPQSDALSKDLKKRGMTFVGSTIIYAYMQAVGMVE
jgi:DNA-3-methyladenine glycosylase I